MARKVLQGKQGGVGSQSPVHCLLQGKQDPVPADNTVEQASSKPFEVQAKLSKSRASADNGRSEMAFEEMEKLRQSSSVAASALGALGFLLFVSSLLVGDVAHYKYGVCLSAAFQG